MELESLNEYLSACDHVRNIKSLMLLYFYLYQKPETCISLSQLAT